MRKFKKGSEIA